MCIRSMLLSVNKCDTSSRPKPSSLYLACRVTRGEWVEFRTLQLVNLQIIIFRKTSSGLGTGISISISRSQFSYQSWIGTEKLHQCISNCKPLALAEVMICFGCNFLTHLSSLHTVSLITGYQQLIVKNTN